MGLIWSFAHEYLTSLSWGEKQQDPSAEQSSYLRLQSSQAVCKGGAAVDVGCKAACRDSNCR